MTIRDFVNRKIGLAADGKPPASALFPVLFYEEDTGKVVTSTDGITITTIRSADKTETIKNKTINVEKNIVSNLNLIQDNPFMTSWCFAERRTYSSCYQSRFILWRY